MSTLTAADLRPAHVGRTLHVPGVWMEPDDAVIESVVQVGDRIHILTNGGDLRLTLDTPVRLSPASVAGAHTVMAGVVKKLAVPAAIQVHPTDGVMVLEGGAARYRQGVVTDADRVPLLDWLTAQAPAPEPIPLDELIVQTVWAGDRLVLVFERPVQGGTQIITDPGLAWDMSERPSEGEDDLSSLVGRRTPIAQVPEWIVEELGGRDGSLDVSEECTVAFVPRAP